MPWRNPKQSSSNLVPNPICCSGRSRTRIFTFAIKDLVVFAFSPHLKRIGASDMGGGMPRTVMRPQYRPYTPCVLFRPIHEKIKQQYVTRPSLAAAKALVVVEPPCCYYLHPQITVRNNIIRRGGDLGCMWLVTRTALEVLEFFPRIVATRQF